MKKQPYNFFNRINLAISGIIIAIKRERHMKYHIILGILLLLPLSVIKVSPIKIWILMILIMQLIVLELINTAIETTVDLVTRHYSHRAKLAKDISSGAVLITAILVVAFAIFIYGSGMYNLFIGVLFGS